MTGPAVAARLAFVLLTAAVLQRGVASQLELAGAVVELLLVVAIAAGLAAGEQPGAVTGFFAGLTLDLLSSGGPLGLWALTYAVAGFVAGRFAPRVERARWFVPVSAAAAVAVGANALYVALALVLDGRNLVDDDLGPILAVAAVANALLVLPALRVMRWVWGTRPDVAIRLR